MPLWLRCATAAAFFCGLREAAMYGNANNNRLFLLFRIGKPFFCAPTDRNVSVGLFKIVVAFAFSYALCKVLSCKTFIIASVFNSHKSKIRHYPLPPRSASRSLRVSMSRSSAAGVGSRRIACGWARSTALPPLPSGR